MEAKRAVLDASRENARDHFRFMHDWLTKMSGLNLGTAARFETRDGHFLECDLVHGLFEQAFKPIIPVLALDACHLKSNVG